MEKVSCFFQRIGMDPHTDVEKTVSFLGRIQTNCVLNIAYENLDIVAGRPLNLAPEVLYEKIVTRSRGGYCFELNGLLAYMLRKMGFSVSERFARFLRGERDVPMRRHRITVVHMEDGDYLCDIGVGQIAPRLPLKIEADTVQPQNNEVYRFTRDSRHGWILWDLYQGDWREYICFTDEEVFDVDFLQPSFFCEAHPDSPFNKRYMLAIKTENGRRSIDDRTYKVFEDDRLIHIEENITDARLNFLLKNEFRMNV